MQSVSVCCPRAVVDFGPLLAVGSEHSVDVERDRTGYNSLALTREVTLRLMSVVISAGYMAITNFDIR